MSVDPANDERRLRLWFAALGGLLLLGTGVAGFVGMRPEWRQVQQGFAGASASRGAPVAGIQELTTCSREVDRCTTCHLRALEESHAGAQESEPYRAHATALAAHPPQRFGCTSCHGGQGRALSSQSAHALAGVKTRDPLLVAPYLEASCGRCHLPGEVHGTERLAHGASLFFTLGCGMCHGLTPGGRGAWDDGPELRTLGRRSVEELKESLFDPKADFAESTMPAYESTFKDHPEELTDLLVFVESLTLGHSRACASRKAAGGGLWAEPCITCHVGERAVGSLQHRCVFLKEQAVSLACGNCHDKRSLASANGDCPVVRERRGACIACHWDPGD